MKLLTIGSNYYPGRRVLIYINGYEDFISHINDTKRFKIVFCEKGQGVFVINQKRLVLFAPFLLCLNEMDQVELEHATNLVAKTLYFHPEAIDTTFTFSNIRTTDGFNLSQIQDRSNLTAFIEHQSFNGIIQIDPLGLDLCNRFFTQINEELTCQGHDFWPCHARSFLYQFLIEVTLMMRKSSKSIIEKAEVKSGDMNEIILYLQRNYQDKITVKDITELFLINRNSLRVKFLHATGLSLIAYLNRWRIQKAAESLKETNLLITEICETVGYQDLTNFGKAFKKHMGCSPRQYRADHSFNIMP